MGKSAVIIGGNGQIGRAVAGSLLDDGWGVAICHRGNRPVPDDLVQRGVKITAINRDVPDARAEALADGADAVIDAVAYNVDHARQLVDCAKDIGALVVISSSSVYTDATGRSLDEADQSGFPELPDPIPETQATVGPGPATYSTRKVALENFLLSNSPCPITLLRAGAIHGPGSQHPREWWFFKRALDRRAVVPLLNPRGRFHTTSTDNLAELIRVVLDRTGRRVLNAGDPDPPTVGEIGTIIAKIAGWHFRFVEVPGGDSSGLIGMSPWSVPLPFVLDMRAAAALGYRPVSSYAQAAEKTCAWMKDESGKGDWREKFPAFKNYSRDPFDYAGEDAFLAGMKFE